MAHVHNKCTFCNAPATYDGKTIMGPWANMCELHFNRYGIKTKGLYSRLEVVPETAKECYLCHQTKPIDEFYKYRDARGVERYRNECKECNLAERKRASFRKKG